MGIESQIVQKLLEYNFCSNEDIDKAKSIQDKYNGKLGNILLNTGVISSFQYIKVLSDIFDLDILNIDEYELKKININNVSSEYYIGNNIYPFFENENSLYVALNYDLNYDKLLELENNTNKNLKINLASDDTINILREIYHSNENDNIEFSDDEVEKLKELASEAPVIKLINTFFNKAIELKASDIHYESFKNGMYVRVRVDGVLIKLGTIPQVHKKAVIARLKLLSKMNISESRLPQDGRIGIKIANEPIDIRASSVPTAFGESFVLRLLGKQTINYSLESLEFYSDHLDILNSIVSSPNGIFLTTGPTGSGKTTTLYSLLNQINTEEVKVITVEDPVEYELSGISQIQVKSEIDFTFANALRSILRQDPDTIMIGEIRDEETARIAIQSALTGHLVLSTLHTNSALGAITRLIDMNIEYFLLKSSIKGLMAQRLVRKLCPHCKESFVPSENLLFELNVDNLIDKYDFVSKNFHKAVGCLKCNHTGYKGRLPVAEILVFDANVQSLMEKNKNFNDLSQLGARSLFEDGILKFIEGKTSYEEILKLK